MLPRLYLFGDFPSVRLSPLDGFTVRISTNAQKMTVFFGAPSPKDGGIEFGGTGFLAVFVEGGWGFGHLVTARHVAERVQPGGDVVVRVNDKAGNAVHLEIDEIAWTYHPDPTVDIAVTPVQLSQKDFDIAYYSLSDIVDPTESAFRVQCGDPISIAGLFHWHSGKQRNKQIVHSGNIALLPDAEERIAVKNRNTGQVDLVEAYLVEAQTFDGLSGAPVFQREMVQLSLYPERHGSPPIAATGVQLLGVYTGAWDAEAARALQHDRRWATEKRVPVGMGIVVPATRIVEIIMNDTELKKTRANILKIRAERNAATTDSSLPEVGSIEPAADNPSHREDFTALLGAAVKKPKSAG